MTVTFHLPGPVAVGGVGGSGTRVVAKILLDFGYYLGNDLNTAHDNLLFTFLLKRPDWFPPGSPPKSDKIDRALHLFDKLMKGAARLNFHDYQYLLACATRMSFRGHNYNGVTRYNNTGRGAWPFKRIVNIHSAGISEPQKYVGWGWKEPNTHIYLEELIKFYKDIKYIHVMRHGLDMAFSKNQKQLHNWGPKFGIAWPQTDDRLPGASLKFWLKSNQRTIEFCNRALKDNFFIINFDKLCLHPDQEIERLAQFLGLAPDGEQMDRVVSIPKKQESATRYQQQDLAQFSSAEIAAVRMFGFTVHSDR